MEVLVLEIFVSLTLVAAALVLFLYSTKHGDHQHGLRLALLPLEEEQAHPIDGSAPAADAAKGKSS